MTLGRKDFSVTRTDGGADVFGLAGFFRDDDLIGHDGLGWKDRLEREHIANNAFSQAGVLATCVTMQWRVSERALGLKGLAKRAGTKRLIKSQRAASVL